jgi:hypothetical protein
MIAALFIDNTILLILINNEKKQSLFFFLIVEVGSENLTIRLVDHF